MRRMRAWCAPLKMFCFCATCRGGNMSHIVVLRPYSYGYKSSTAAKVSYKHSQSDDQVQVSFSNDLGMVPVLSSKDDDKLAAPHLVTALFLGTFFYQFGGGASG